MMSYRKTLSENSTRSPEQQRAVQAGTKHAGAKPKDPGPEKMGLAPDEASAERRQDLEKGRRR
jgi:hypothetical protein